MEITSDWGNEPVNFPQLEKLTRAIMRLADPDWHELSVTLLDDDGITGLNREYFGKDEPTDVISFTYDKGAGDVYVNAERAARAKNSSYELALYIAHGCDHLAGADDRTPARRARMLKRERQWLKEAGAQAADLFQIAK